MVLNERGVFTLDLSFAVLIYSLIFFFTFSMVAIIIDNGTNSYENTKLMVRIFDASEVILTNPNVTEGGLAVYRENAVKHHELDIARFGTFVDLFPKIKQKLLLGDLDVSISITNEKRDVLLKVGKPINGTKVSRIALCGGESCVVEIIAK